MTRLILDTEVEAPLNLVGGKGKGLLKLKSLETRLNEFISAHSQVFVPPFFIIPAEVNLASIRVDILQRAKQFGDSYAVRSSSCLEDVGEHSFDGIFETQRDVVASDLLKAIYNVRKSATSDRARRYANDFGIELSDKMPVIVQAMVDQKDQTGVIYSKFPAPRDVLKIIRDIDHSKERYIDVFPRITGTNGSLCVDLGSPVVVSREYDDFFNFKIETLAITAIKIEKEFGYPVILEFASYESGSTADKYMINLLQARRLTKFSDVEKFQRSELQERGLIATTYDLNGVGDFTGEAFVIGNPADMAGNIRNICNEEREAFDSFDRLHMNGYVLVAPFLQFYYNDLDVLTPNKKAVLAYTDLGRHHDMEISRKKGILYLNVRHCLGMSFTEYGGELPIKTGERIRVVSDGERGFVFNLSREYK